MPEIEFVAGADVDPTLCRALEERFPGVRAYNSVAALCRDSAVEAIWISTPNHFHCEHALEAMRNGKHVVVEKPIGISMDEADRMCAAAAEHGVKLIGGHTNSYGLAIRAMRCIALSGVLGKPRAIFIWSYTDWLIRPRTADELITGEGGGLVHRQAVHQIDIVRLLGGGKLRSIRGSIGQWMPERPCPGFYTAYLEFADGMPATILHNSYGYFLTSELYPWAPAMFRYSDEDRIALRRALRAGPRDEVPEKAEFRIGGKRDRTRRQMPTEPLPWTPFDYGMLILSCERGDMRHSMHGLSIYADDGRYELDLRPFVRPEIDFEAGLIPATLEELHAAVVLGQPAYHSGEWARASLEATMALFASTDERREVLLERQVEMPEEYDETLRDALSAAVASAPLAR